MKNLFAYDGGLSRRSFLAASAAGLCALSLSPLDAMAADAGSWGKILVLYYSRSGNTRAVAEDIHTKVGGDIFQLKTARPYPESYDDVVEIAKKEKTSNARPAYAEPVPDLNSFNTVFIGYPCWWEVSPCRKDHCALHHARRQRLRRQPQGFEETLPQGEDSPGPRSTRHGRPQLGGSRQLLAEETGLCALNSFPGFPRTPGRRKRNGTGYPEQNAIPD